MTYRKFKADYLFTGEDLAGSDSVLITAADGTVQDVVPAAAAGEDIVCYSGLLSPGFVNCHCHLELSHLRGAIPEGTGLVDFLSAVTRMRGSAGMKKSGDADADGEPEGIRQAIAGAEEEMLDGGIVAVGDICNSTDTLEQKRKGRLYYHNFIETIGFIGKGAQGRWGHSLAVYDQFGGLGSIVPHAPYSVSPELFRLIAGFPGNHLLTIHNQESEEENLFLRSGGGDLQRLYRRLGLDISFYRGTGGRSMESWLPYFRHDQTVIAVHNVATEKEDLAAMTADGPRLYFCLCPRANLYIGGRLPDIPMLVRHGCKLVMGTDSLASNHGLSILEELRVLQRAFPEISLETMLRWATYNGAEALGMDSLGSFSRGKKPGVILLQGLEAVRRLL